MTKPERRLVVLRESPWSERAKWALDHHGLSYQTIHHTPFLGERRLRRLAGAPRKRVTVPILLAGDQTLIESWDIAHYADREGNGNKLIPHDHEADIQRWNDLADEAMSAGRALLVPVLLRNAKALDEQVPPFVPRWTRPLLRPFTRHATAWFGNKYGLHLEDAPAHLARMRTALEILRAALEKSSPYLLGDFSYADIVMAVSLQGVSPVDDRYIPLEPASRQVWTRSDLAAEFADLIAWRNQLYELHRVRSDRSHRA
jgi:glutathione S-transferase